MLILVSVESCHMSHITYEQRYTIQKMLEQKKSQTEIANTIGKHKSVVCREIKRNSNRDGGYSADSARRKAELRVKNKPKSKRLTESLLLEITHYLSLKYSPEQITGRLRKEGKPMVSHECIYQYIWKDKRNGGVLYKHLRRQGRRYRKRANVKAGRGLIPNRVDISQRPLEVEMKRRFGDLEVDTIIGRSHKEAIVTINDRASGMLKMRKVEKKSAQKVKNVVVEMLQDWLPFIQTMTADNGKEFAQHEAISEELNIEVYFARPYHSWERGANENLNGLIRQYFPKKTDFKTITNQQIQDAENELNNRPRKRLNFESPLERMNNILFFNPVAFVT